jgi:hypothetical protein
VYKKDPVVQTEMEVLPYLMRDISVGILLKRVIC